MKSWHGCNQPTHCAGTHTCNAQNAKHLRPKSTDSAQRSLLPMLLCDVCRQQKQNTTQTASKQATTHIRLQVLFSHGLGHKVNDHAARHTPRTPTTLPQACIGRPLLLSHEMMMMTTAQQ